MPTFDDLERDDYTHLLVKCPQCGKSTAIPLAMLRRAGAGRTEEVIRRFTCRECDARPEEHDVSPWAQTMAPGYVMTYSTGRPVEPRPKAVPHDVPRRPRRARKRRG